MYVKEVLDNGLTIIGEEIPHVRSVSIGIWVGAGISHETTHTNGISHFIEHMLFKGTKKRSALDIAESLDEVGGKLNAFTAKEYTLYYTVVLDSHVYRAMDVLTDIFLNSTFHAADMRMEKKVVLEEIKMYQDTPDELIHDLFAETLWQGHVMGRPVLGEAAVIEKLDRKDIKNYMKKMYVPNNMIISIAGNFSFDDIVDELKSRFEVLVPGQLQNTYKRPRSHSKVNVLYRDTEQVHVCLGSNGYAYDEQERFAVSMLNAILGGSMSSRLFQEVREKRGLAYSIYSYNSYYRNSGLFCVYFGTGPENVKEVLKLVKKEFEGLINNGVSEAELRKAKEHTKGSMVLGLESSGNRMSWNAKNFFYRNKFVTIEDIFSVINDISLDQIQKVADHLLSKDRLCLTAIGPVNSGEELRGIML